MHHNGMTLPKCLYERSVTTAFLLNRFNHWRIFWWMFFLPKEQHYYTLNPMRECSLTVFFWSAAKKWWHHNHYHKFLNVNKFAFCSSLSPFYQTKCVSFLPALMKCFMCQIKYKLNFKIKETYKQHWSSTDGAEQN